MRNAIDGSDSILIPRCKNRQNCLEEAVDQIQNQTIKDQYGQIEEVAASWSGKAGGIFVKFYAGSESEI